MNSILLWVAKEESVAGASLRAPVPFYLVSLDDPQAIKKIVEFLDKRFGLGIDFQDLDERIRRQNDKIARLINRFPEIGNYIKKLETNAPLNQEENEKLIKEIEEFFQRENDE